MEKNVRYLLWICLSVFIVSCADVYKEDESEEEKVIIPPGETYTSQNTYNLNVVYYVPADKGDVADWHYRLSGITLHMQNYYHENFLRYQMDKKFGLELNDVNPEFIKIHYIKSKIISAEMKKENMTAMSQEVMAYFEKNPELKSSNHFLVYAPDYQGTLVTHCYPTKDQGMAFCGCDNEKFNIKYFESARARRNFLAQLGFAMKELGHALFLVENDMGSDTALRSLMGWSEFLHVAGFGSTADKYGKAKYNCMSYAGLQGAKQINGIPDKIRLSLSDIRYLNGIQLFNDDYSYEEFEVKIEDVTIGSLKNPESFEKDIILVICKFYTPVELEGVVLLNDPWRSHVNMKLNTADDENEFIDTGGDAYTVYASHPLFEDLGGGHYEVRFMYPMGNMLSPVNAAGMTAKVSNEIRFRFLGKNGMAYPHPATSIKGPMEHRYVYEITNNYDSKTRLYHKTHNVKEIFGVIGNADLVID